MPGELDNEPITDSTLAWKMTGAEQPFRDELHELKQSFPQTYPELVHPDERRNDLQTAFELGRLAGEAAARAQAAYEPEPVYRFVGGGSLLAFGRERGPQGRRLAGRAWRGLMYDIQSESPTPDYRPVWDTAEGMISQLRELAMIHSSQLELGTARRLIDHIVRNIGYDKMKNHPVIYGWGPAPVSFLADYLNVTLGLEGDERIPLYAPESRRNT